MEIWQRTYPFADRQRSLRRVARLNDALEDNVRQGGCGVRVRAGAVGTGTLRGVLDEFTLYGERVRWQGRDHFLIKSKSEDGHHVVEWDDSDGGWVCSCTGFSCRRDCRHARAVARWREPGADTTHGKASPPPD